FFSVVSQDLLISELHTLSLHDALPIFGSDSLSEIANQAQSNLDLALGRGGDQVVLRQPGKDARFYGGKSNPMEKRTRVRARMVSQAISELFKDADQVFVVGHQRPDMDSVGSG